MRELFGSQSLRYFESRGGKFDQVVFFGLQYFLKRYLQGQAEIKRVHRVKIGADLC